MKVVESISRGISECASARCSPINKMRSERPDASVTVQFLFQEMCVLCTFFATVQLTLVTSG